MMAVFRFVLSVIVFISTVSPLSEKDFPFHNNRISHATHAAAFDRLLNSIAKVNQQRLDNIKKMTRLQELKPYSELRADSTRDSDDASSSSSEEREVIYLVIPDTREPTQVTEDGHRLAEPINITSGDRVDTNHSTPKPEPKPHKPDILLEPIRSHNISTDYITPRGTNESLAHMSLSTDGLEYLRQSIARSCKNKDVKRCRRACKDAVSSSCSMYDCRRKLKKSLKRNCKRSCKEEFSGGW